MATQPLEASIQGSSKNSSWQAQMQKYSPTTYSPVWHQAQLVEIRPTATCKPCDKDMPSPPEDGETASPLCTGNRRGLREFVLAESVHKRLKTEYKDIQDRISDFNATHDAYTSRFRRHIRPQSQLDQPKTAGVPPPRSAPVQREFPLSESARKPNQDDAKSKQVLSLRDCSDSSSGNVQDVLTVSENQHSLDGVESSSNDDEANANDQNDDENDPDDVGEQNEDEKAKEPRSNSQASRELDRSRTTLVHPKGTVALIVGPNDAEQSPRCIVVSPDIKHLSPEWENIIAKSKRKSVLDFKGLRRVRLVDEDPDMMLVLMWIVHAEFARVPRTLRFNQLLEMARICKHFDMNVRIDPYVAGWISPHRANILQSGHEQWLYISHQFGLEKDYLRLAQHLALSCRTDEHHRLLTPRADRVLVGYFPRECLADIRHTRVKALVSFLNIVYNLINNMIDGNTCQASASSQQGSVISNEERSLCTLYNHGLLIRYLKMLDYYPPKMNVGVIRDSVREIAAKLTSAPAIRMPSMNHESIPDNVPSAVTTSPLADRHEACDAGRVLAVRVQEVLHRMDYPVTQQTVDKIRENGRKIAVLGAMTKERSNLLEDVVRDINPNKYYDARNWMAHWV